MEVIEIQNPGEWSYKTDFEGLSERVGGTEAEDIYDILNEFGIHTDSSGIVYRLENTEK